MEVKLNQRTVVLSEFLTPQEIARCVELTNARAIRDEVIAPNLERINKKLGQTNDAMYLAYAVEYVITQSQQNKGK